LCVFQRAKRNREGFNSGYNIKQGKLTRNLLDQWLLGTEAIVQMTEDILLTYSPQANSALCTPPSEVDSANIKRTRKLMQLGRFSDATKALLSNGVLTINDIILHQLLEKHPRRQSALPHLDHAPPPLVADVETVTKALLSFKKGTANGRDGLSADLLKSFYSLFTLREVFMSELTTVFPRQQRGALYFEL
jgi:hypothetical protein